MHGMSVAGRRAEVLWRKGSFTTGKGQQRTYDTFVVRFGFMVPFALGDAVHIWDIPRTTMRGPCKAIRLHPDPAFKRRVLVSNWAGMGALALLIAVPFLWAKVHAVAGALALVASVGLAVWGWLSSREARRDRSIRLLLGLHEWGSSDPATWASELVAEVVDPQEAFGSESFAALSRWALAEGRWGEAMWAARLCAAVEDLPEGEALTDTILREPEVVRGLRRVRRRPASRDGAFGKAPPLRRWLACEPAEYITMID